MPLLVNTKPLIEKDHPQSKDAFFSRFMRRAAAAYTREAAAGRPAPSEGMAPLPFLRSRRLESANAAASGYWIEPAIAGSCACTDCLRDGVAGEVVCCYEGRPVCSPRCLALLVEVAIQRGMAQQDRLPESYRHRMPIGLLMLSRRWITEQQLGVALSSQRRVGYGRLGEWLIAGGATDELRVAGAIAAQWGIPLLQSEEQSRAATILLPRLLVEAYAVVPMRISGGILYLAIDQRVDPCLNLAIEKMTGLSVEPVAMSGRAFRRARQEFVDSAHPPVRHFQAASLRGLRDTVLAVAAEKQTRNFRLVRVHEYFWLRVERELEMRPQDLRSDGGGVEDCIFTYPERSAVGKPPLEN